MRSTIKSAVGAPATTLLVRRFFSGGCRPPDGVFSVRSRTRSGRPRPPCWFDVSLRGIRCASEWLQQGREHDCRNSDFVASPEKVGGRRIRRKKESGRSVRFLCGYFPFCAFLRLLVANHSIQRLNATRRFDVTMRTALTSSHGWTHDRTPAATDADGVQPPSLV